MADGTRLFQMYQRQSPHSSGSGRLMHRDGNKDKFHQTSSEGRTAFMYGVKGYCRERGPMKGYGAVLRKEEE